jgi:hypothetical protein
MAHEKHGNVLFLGFFGHGPVEIPDANLLIVIIVQPVPA